MYATIQHELGCILSFKYKGLERFYQTGSTSGIQVAHAAKLSRLLARLDCAKAPNDMNLPGWHLHRLTGKLAGHWSVKVNGNWRLTFKLENNHAEIVDYQDYH
nr:type II toxin-antitoxin system RelE/ParE family toxin [Aggregatibacter actinomycetemcomitans]